MGINVKYELNQLEREAKLAEEKNNREKENLIEEFKSFNKEDIFKVVPINEQELKMEIQIEEDTNEEYLHSIFKQLGVKNLPNPEI